MIRACSFRRLRPNHGANNDCTRSLLTAQGSSTIVIVDREIAKFWADLREELRRGLGQEAGKRNKRTAIQREQLASELSLSSVTLKSFLNGNQATLGREALFALFVRTPGLEARYKKALTKQNGSAKGGKRKADHGLRIQMTLQFEGSHDLPKVLSARFPAGRQGVLTVIIDPRRIA